MLPINSGGHTTYQDFVFQNLRKYYPDPNKIARSTWDIIDRFWNLDLSYTDDILMLQHLDAWDLPFESALRKLIQQAP